MNTEQFLNSNVVAVKKRCIAQQKLDGEIDPDVLSFGFNVSRMFGTVRFWLYTKFGVMVYDVSMPTGDINYVGFNDWRELCDYRTRTI